jgi:RimJ/RimL family protein N-acetyltransferase
MRITRYGIVLESLTETDLEMVRLWRNADHVRTYMEYQTHITPEMQNNWFSALDKTTNLYFVISKDSEKIGVINLKDIHREKKTAEAGIFIGNSNFLNTMVPVLAVISLMDLAFQVLGIKELKAKIQDGNKKVILFNESIGYRRSETGRQTNFNYYSVAVQQYVKATEAMRNMLDKLSVEGS